MHWLVNDRRLTPRLVVRYKYHNYIGMRMRIASRDLNHAGELGIRCVATKFWLRVKRQATAASSSSTHHAAAVTAAVAAALPLVFTSLLTPIRVTTLLLAACALTTIAAAAAVSSATAVTSREDPAYK